MIYGTFVFGYDADTPASFDRAAAFAREQSLCIANFNPLTPMPGTGLYDRLRAEGRLMRDHWWLDPSYRYGDAIFAPRGMSPDELSEGPMRARRAFYGWGSIAGRALRGAPMWRDPYKIGTMLLANWISRREIMRKQGRPLAGRAFHRARRGHAVKLTLIKPTIGRMTHSLYVDEARMEPLNLGVLAALTPEDVDVVDVRRPHGADPVSTSRPISSPSRSRPTRRAAPTRSPTSIAGAACR